jgi:hypothetical protein
MGYIRARREGEEKMVQAGNYYTYVHREPEVATAPPSIERYAVAERPVGWPAFCILTPTGHGGQYIGGVSAVLFTQAEEGTVDEYRRAHDRYTSTRSRTLAGITVEDFVVAAIPSEFCCILVTI